MKKLLFKKNYDVFTILCIIVFAKLIDMKANFFITLLLLVACAVADVLLSEKYGYERTK